MKDNKANIVFYCIGGVAVIWLSLLIAPYIDEGIIEIIKQLPKKMKNPFEIEFCKNSIKTILIFLSVYLLGIGIYISTRRNYKKGKEYGSASWGNAKQINKKYKQTIIMITHNKEIANEADRVLTIEDGKIIKEVH